MSCSKINNILPFILEHCGSLPYMTEIVGFNGPIYMTHPTKAIVPIILEELRKVNTNNKVNWVSTQLIKNCMKKVTGVDLHQSIMVDNELEIKAYYAGHVLGAAMFWLRVGSQTVVYTGDFNMNPDRHLGAAWIDKCQPDLLITESMNATINTTTKPCRKNDFLKIVHDCMSRGGKVLIPVFLFGRAQELCIILNAYWEKMNLSYPIYFATDTFTEKANFYYKKFYQWTNPKMSKSNTDENTFEFKHIKSFNRSYIDKPEPMVVLATNGMLQQGLSTHIFKKWAEDENNVLILPDFCQKGTIGHKIAAGVKQIEFGGKDKVNVKLKVEQMTFDAVADVNGILEFIEACNPKNIILTQGTDRLRFLQNVIKDKFKIKCLFPMLGETCVIETPLKIPTDNNLLPQPTKTFSEMCALKLPKPFNRIIGFWILVAREQRILLLSLHDAIKEVSDKIGSLQFYSKISFEDSGTQKSIAEKLFAVLKEKLVDWSVQLHSDFTITVESLKIIVEQDNADSKMTNKIITISWKNNDEDIALYILYFLKCRR